jgi:transposase-like protein
VFTHFVHGRPVRVVMHQPYYCAQCNRHFKRENAFHRHLRRQHRIAHRIRHHLARVGWGWVYFG